MSFRIKQILSNHPDKALLQIKSLGERHFRLDTNHVKNLNLDIERKKIVIRSLELRLQHIQQVFLLVSANWMISTFNQSNYL